MSLKRLDGLLARFSVNANLIHLGPLCGVTDEPAIAGKGYLHVVRSGLVEVRQSGRPTLHIVEPTLLLYARSVNHSFLTDTQSGAELVCATVAFNAGLHNPLVQALPPLLLVPLADAPELQPIIEMLFQETSSAGQAGQAVADRLFEVLVIRLLRRVVDRGMMSTGMLAGLAHPQLGAALVVLHDAPERAWTLESLAAVAGMSRSGFAKTFKAVLGVTAGDYLTDWRITLAQGLLRNGTALRQVAPEVGYGSALALSRAFKARVGLSPREWLLQRK